jgi:hypothetical protein
MIPTVPFCMQVPYEEQRVICNGKPLMLDSRKTMKQVNASVILELHAYLVSNSSDITCTQIEKIIMNAVVIISDKKPCFLSRKLSMQTVLLYSPYC